MSKKKKVLDTSLIDNIRGVNKQFSEYLAPQADVRSYLLEAENPQYLSKPDDYGFTDYVSDAYSSWDLMRNQTNYSTRMGEFQLEQSDILAMDEAEQYLNNISVILASQNSNDPQVVEQGKVAARQNATLRQSYDKVREQFGLDGDLSNQINTIQTEKNTKLEKQQQSLAEAEEYFNRTQEIINKNNISNYYKQKEEEGIFDYTLDSFLYKLPGIMGSSSSSLKTQIAGGVTSLAAAAVAMGFIPLTGGMSTLALGGLGATNLGLGMYGATEENKAEVYDNLKTRVTQEAIKNKSYDEVIKEARAKYTGDLNLTDDQLLDQVLSGQIKVDNVAFNKSLRKALTGVDALYQNDMWKTFGTEAVESAIEIMPFGSIAKLGRKSNTIAKGLDKFNRLSDRAKAVVGKVSDRIESAAHFGVEKSIEGMAKRRAKNFIFDAAKRQLVLAANEMGEESVQYLNGQEYIDGKYDGKDPSWLTSVLGNAAGTARSMYAFFTPWDGALASDEEWLENARSGAVLGLFNIGNVASTAMRTRGAVKQYKADNWLASYATTDMFADKDAVQKGIYYADKAGNGLRKQVLESFDTARGIGIEGIEDSQWAEEQGRAERVMGLATSSKVKKLAEQRGLKSKTDDYNIYVSMIDYYTNREKEARDQYNTTNKAVQEIIQNDKALEDAVAFSYLDGSGQQESNEESIQIGRAHV